MLYQGVLAVEFIGENLRQMSVLFASFYYGMFVFSAILGAKEMKRRYFNIEDSHLPRICKYSADDTNQLFRCALS